MGRRVGFLGMEGTAIRKEEGMIHARLYDGAFPATACLNAAGDNEAMHPARLTWERGGWSPVAFYTDTCLKLAAETTHQRKIAWLLEPPPFRQCNYDFVREHADLFDYVLTYDARLIDGKKFLYYPYGGSQIPLDHWGVKPKSKLCSIVASDKRATEGHNLRHAAVEMIRTAQLPVDVLGSGYGPFVNKYDALADYYYTVAIEGESLDFCFDEKLLDPLAVGTVPLYWGCPHIDAHFNVDSIRHWHDLEQLRGMLLRLTPEWWFNRLPAIHGNLERARAFVCAEDWIVDRYPFLFEV
jgi:hypothetical protein